MCTYNNVYLYLLRNEIPSDSSSDPRIYLDTCDDVVFPLRVGIAIQCTYVHAIFVLTLMVQCAGFDDH